MMVMSLEGTNSSISIVWGNRRTPAIMSLSHGIGLLGFLNYPSSLQNWKPNFFFVSRSGWEFVPSEDLDKAPKFFHSWGVPVSSASFLSFSCFFMSNDDRWVTCISVCSFLASSSEEKVSTSSWKSEVVLGVRQRFWWARFSSISISSLFGSGTVY